MICSVSTSELIIDKESAEKNFPLLKEAGFDAIDLGFDMIFEKTGGKLSPDLTFSKSSFYELSDKEFFEYLDGIKNAAEKNNVKIGQCHAPFPSCWQGESKEFFKKVINRTIIAAGYLSCPYIVIHPRNFPLDNNIDKEAVFNANVEFYSEFIDVLKENKVIACLENMYSYRKNKIFEATCNDYDEVNRYIEVLNKKAGSECFGFCLDTGHCVLTSTNIRYAIKTLGKNLKVLHLHEVSNNLDNHTIPFTLEIVDWDFIMTALKDYGYEGTLNFETVRAWRIFPKELEEDVIKMLGSIAKYFKTKYF